MLLQKRMMNFNNQISMFPVKSGNIYAVSLEMWSFLQIMLLQKVTRQYHNCVTIFHIQIKFNKMFLVAVSIIYFLPIIFKFPDIVI